jgi:hypothetical protein
MYPEPMSRSTRTARSGRRPGDQRGLVYRPDSTFARPITSPGAELLDRPSGLALRRRLAVRGQQRRR